LRTRKASRGWTAGAGAVVPVSVDESAADEDVVEGAAGGVPGPESGPVVGSCVWGMRTQTIHHPRLVLQVRSSSRGLERVSMYVVKRR